MAPHKILGWQSISELHVCPTRIRSRRRPRPRICDRRLPVLELFIYAQVALQDVELVVTCKDAGGRPCKLPMACMSFIENSVDRREKCCIETIINSFDINVCSVAMRLRGDGDHEYVVSPEDAAAIKSKTMWLRSSYYRQPDPARVEKYRSRGFTLVADPAIP